MSKEHDKLVQEMRNEITSIMDKGIADITKTFEVLKKDIQKTVDLCEMEGRRLSSIEVNLEEMKG